MSTSKKTRLKLIHQLHDFAIYGNPKIAPEKLSFMLLTVKCLGDEIASKTIKSLQSEVAAIRKIRSPTKKVELMMFNCSINFTSKFFHKFPVQKKPR